MDFREIEEKWQKKWEESRIFQADPDDREKFFITIPYPYLNGNLHAGHTRTFTIGDAVARYKRMLGYNVLFPMGFHVTGTPIIGLAELIQKRDERTIKVYTQYHNVPEEILLTLTTPERIVEYFSKEAEKAMKMIGYSIDWRRKFTTMDECYQKFIEWQYWRLKEKGLIVKGSHPVRFCPNDNNPVEDHDLLMGEEATIVEYTVIKFRLGDIIFPCATLRPETVFGVTNIWLKPTKYVLAKVDGEKWIVSFEAFEKLKYFDKKVEKLGEVDAEEFFGKVVENPVTKEKVPILPAEFIDTDNATGVVMSVPAHAPYDYVALKQLAEDEETLKKYGIDKKLVESLKPIVLIKIEEENYEIPAKEIVEEMGIKDQKDEALEKATKIIYKKEYHKGVMLDNTLFPGVPVSEAKEKVHDYLIKNNLGDVFYEFSEKPVVCRCGTKCVVKVVKDQWFINYSNEEWKKKVLEHLERMTIIPEYYKKEFRNKIEWLKDKACARRKGLGTRIPWDREWLIESLSDSTIYMAYYIIAKFVNSGKLKPENLVPEFFDYVFLSKGSVEEVAKKSGLSREVIEEVKREFEYWYPVDLRSSGKDLVANHLLFYLFHHVALFPEKYWPRAIAVNGYVSLEGQKMSKSKGPLLTMKKAVEEFGADVTRLYILHAAEYDSDADWRRKDVEGLASNLRRFYEIVKENYLKEPEEMTTLDKWLVSRMQKAIKETRDAMEKLQTRRAVNAAFFEMMNDVRWYLRRGGKNLVLILDDWIRLLAPFAPHICEELWSMKHDNFVSLEKYPEYDESKVDEKAEVAENYIRTLLKDISEIMKFVKDAKEVYIAVAEEWKREVAKIAKQTGNMKEAMKVIMSDERFKDLKKEIPSFVKRLFKEGFDFYEIDERKVISEALEFFEKELKVKVYLDESKVPEEKRKAAMPGKPAIYVV
ncbi:leucyl-tRNA synthetase [Ferroglobus placidus DSM 10642]|uniref:Leucine--tRNA ligase n=1 Tax=Ferroglobus placidus (strain DSM 10642 / AEDII12DO) TaxID=589924 RepID=D3S2F9_FERPA|nr:leucine--tRNA ligase [Ferroglobus placidus]ADC64489.1 leucyl-tRNA synthetase [Ferroglobus placidus DSM 10642]